jgi:phosphotransferase system enzyme I (PtsP)
VASVYVRERHPLGDDVLVMRGNVGFPPEAIGQVRLALGEGITGFVAECLRPVSCAVAGAHSAFEPVPGLGEERFPSFLGLPLVLGGEAVGVLVVQRRVAKRFAPVDVTLAAALSAPVAYALERAMTRRAGSSLPVGGSVLLKGVGVSPGSALGRAQIMPALAASQAPEASDVGALLEAVGRELSRSAARILPSLEPAARARAHVLALLLDDQRLRELAVEESRNAGLGAGLRRVAREYVRATERAGLGQREAEAWLSERAGEVEDLCTLVAAAARKADVPSPGEVLLCERLTGCLALAAAGRHASAVVVGGPVDADNLGAAVLRAARLPVIAEVAGLYAWARPGDRVLIDAQAGLVRVNPTPGEEARFRATKPGPSPAAR